jgi:hypothetical protein
MFCHILRLHFHVAFEPFPIYTYIVIAIEIHSPITYAGSQVFSESHSDVLQFYCMLVVYPTVQSVAFVCECLLSCEADNLVCLLIQRLALSMMDVTVRKLGDVFLVQSIVN